MKRKQYFSGILLAIMLLGFFSPFLGMTALAVDTEDSATTMSSELIEETKEIIPEPTEGAEVLEPEAENELSEAERTEAPETNDQPVTEFEMPKLEGSPALMAALIDEPTWGSVAEVANEAQLQTALSQSSVDTIRLLSDIEVDGEIVIERSLFLDGNGFALTFGASGAARGNGVTLADVTGEAYFKVANLLFGNVSTATANRNNAYFRATDAVAPKWSMQLIDSSTISGNYKPILNMPGAKVSVETTGDQTNVFEGSLYSLPLFTSGNGELSFSGKNQLVNIQSSNPLINGNFELAGEMSVTQSGRNTMFQADTSAKTEGLKLTILSADDREKIFDVINGDAQLNNTTIEGPGSLGTIAKASGDISADGLVVTGAGYDEAVDPQNVVAINGNVFEFNQKLTLKNSLLALNASGRFAVSSFSNPSDPTEDYAGNRVTIDNSRIYGSYSDIFANTKEFLITNQAYLKIEHGNNFYYNDEIKFGLFQVDKRSKVYLVGTSNNNTLEVTGAQSSVNVLGDASLGTLEDNTTFDVQGQSRQTGDSGGILNFDTGAWGPAVYLNFKDYAKVTIHSAADNSTPAVLMQSVGAQFNVSNHADVTLLSEGESNSRGATLRFRYSGLSEFNLSQNSTMRITKKSGRASAIRMNGGGNGIKVESGSKFFVTNYGDGTPRNGSASSGAGANNYNTAITYINERAGGSSNPEHKVADYFTLTGKDSVVKIDAKYGPAIDSAYDTQVVAAEDTFFEAHGNTAGGPIFRTGLGALDFEMTQPMYFDFRNNASGGGDLLGSNENGYYDNSKTARFISKESNVSFWKKGTDLDGTPDYDRTLVTFSLTGANMVLDQSPDNDFTTNFGENNSVNQYSRMSANNAAPTIRNIRQATDADKRLDVYATVLEGYDDEGNRTERPAWDGEVQLVLELDVPGIGKQTIQGTSVNGPEDIYNDQEQRGFVTFDLPEFLKAGTTVTVKEAWRGLPEADENARHSTSAEDLGKVDPMTVIDVTPPDPAELSTGGISNATKVLTGENAEAGAILRVGVKKAGAAAGDQPTMLAPTATVAEDGTWSYDLPSYLAVGDTVVILLEDQTGKITAVSDAPSTNNDNGNINPIGSEVHYHDATFPPANEYLVVDAVIDEASITKEVVSSGGETTQAGDQLTYTLKVKNDEAEGSEIIWRDVQLIDELDEGLTFDEQAELTINDVTATTDDYQFRDGILTIKVGDLAPGQEAVAVFKVTVNQKAVGRIITNEAEGKGNTPIEAGDFVPGHVEEPTYETFSVKSAGVDNPGGTVFGTLTLVSAPRTIDFKLQTIDGKDTYVNDPDYDGELVVSDNRAVQEEWQITAQMTKPLTVENGSQTNPNDILVDAIRYQNGEQEITLDDTPQAIVTHKNEGIDPYNVSNTWSPEGNGFKLFVPAGGVPQLGSYQGEILWQLSDAP